MHIPTIIAASDIHGSDEAFQLLLSRIAEHHGDELFLAGDIGISSLPDLSLCPYSLTLVRGNCDSSYGFSEAGRMLPPLVQRVPWNGRTVVMTHGDRWPSPYGLDMQADDIFIFGHIHVPRLYRDPNGVVILNPGSTTYPRDGYPASYAVMETQCITIHRLLDDKELQILDLINR
jgi:putative phosphoesterase